MTSTEIVPAASATSLEPLDPASRELAVTAYLQQARSDLALAVEMSGPAAVAAVKAQIATAAEATKQLGLSKEIRDDALEMVRRAEYALGKAIRAGQDNETILRPHEAQSPNGVLRHRVMKNKVTDFAKPSELSGSSPGKPGIYALVDGVAEPDFERALGEARAEGDVSRANVVRKIKGEQPKPSGERHELLKRTRRVDSNLIVAGTVEAAAVPASTLELVNYADLDRDSLGEWISSLSESIRTLRALRSRLEKELHREQV